MVSPFPTETMIAAVSHDWRAIWEEILADTSVDVEENTKAVYSKHLAAFFKVVSAPGGAFTYRDVEDYLQAYAEAFAATVTDVDIRVAPPDGKVIATAGSVVSSGAMGEADASFDRGPSPSAFTALISWQTGTPFVTVVSV